jgi:SAM-dependent methyltransferase
MNTNFQSDPAKINERIRYQAEQHPLVQRKGFKTVEDYCNHLMYQKAYEVLFSRVSGKLVLDLGCNDGFGSSLLASRAGEVVGVDVSAKSLKEAAAQYGSRSLHFMPVDGISLPFRDATFDFVVSFQVIEHISDYDAYLSEIRRVLRPGGSAVFTTPNAKIRLDPGMRPWNALHVKEFAASELEALLRKWFPSVTLSGLFGTPDIYKIEFDRVQAHLAKARRANTRMVPPGWVIRAAAIDAVKRILPDSIVENLRATARRSHVDVSNDREETGAPSLVDSFPYSTANLFYRADNIDQSLGLMATCSID